MMTWELEMSSLPMPQNVLPATLAYSFLLLFVLMMAVVLMNLLNGSLFSFLYVFI
jgi:hypothetical protein